MSTTKKIFLFTACIGLLITLLSFKVSAHEVYVLNPEEISFALTAPRPDFISTIQQHLGQFALWGSLVTIILIGIFFTSISKPLEKLLDPILIKIKKYAPHIAQITIGLALLASGYYHAIFGVELPTHAAFPGMEIFVNITLIVVGTMLVLGIIPRIAAFVATLIFLILIIRYGVYMLNYGTYLGESITILLFGGAHTMWTPKKLGHLFSRSIHPKFHETKFLIMRILFGISLIYASLYAKLFHGALALETVTKFNLTHYFPFDPVFLVLGAMLIEVLLGVAFLIGFEIRFASLFFLVFLSLSLVFFGEAVWPHIILIGTALAMFAHGYDKYTFEVAITKTTKEPIL